MSKKNENKQNFDLTIKPFVENGYVKILFQNEEYAICNYANQCYLFFPHSVCDYGIMFQKANLITCVENPNLILSQLSKLSDAEFRALTCVMSDKTFQNAKLTKEYTDKNGPSEYVDLEVDKYVLENYSNSITGRRK